ncbi:hypothetical protein HMPREF9554_02510 [Treponema phagedenis F0421]|nr:hypothetical protein HMPREF9554_02510 [Treponema phagedenis F0421]
MKLKANAHRFVFLCFCSGELFKFHEAMHPPQKTSCTLAVFMLLFDYV